MKPGQKTNLREPCPCGSGKKYKSCCYPTDREKAQLRHASRSSVQPSLKERTTALIDAVREIMGITRQIDWGKIKETISSNHVRAIYGVIADLWPRETDLDSILPEPSDTELRALYLGDVKALDIVRNVFRFSLYSDRIYIVDPFFKPWELGREFNPLEAPGQWVPDALKLVYFLLLLEPWIKNEIVVLIPDPGSFDRKLRESTWELGKTRLSAIPLDEADFNEFEPKMIEEYARLFYCQPDEILSNQLRRKFPDITEKELTDELLFAAKVRKGDLLSPEKTRLNGDGYLMIGRTGANLEMSLYLAQLLDAFPYTSTKRKWKELSFVAEAISETARIWTPLTRGFQNLTFNFLDDVDTTFACNMRLDGRLSGFRDFLRHIWLELSSKATNPHDAEPARAFADRLTYEHNKATEEWKKINEDWLSFAHSVSWGQILAMLGTAPTQGIKPIIEGGLHWAIPAGGFCIGGVLELLKLRCKRRTFRKAVPMSVFIDLAKRRGK